MSKENRYVVTFEAYVYADNDYMAISYIKLAV